MDLTLKQEFVRQKLIEVARKRDTVTYRVVGGWLGWSGQALRSVGRYLLDPIAQYEHDRCRPDLTTIVVSANTGEPGEAHGDMPRKWGLLLEGEDPLQFWRFELRRVYACWDRQDR